MENKLKTDIVLKYGNKDCFDSLVEQKKLNIGSEVEIAQLAYVLNMDSNELKQDCMDYYVEHLKKYIDTGRGDGYQYIEDKQNNIICLELIVKCELEGESGVELLQFRLGTDNDSRNGENVHPEFRLLGISPWISEIIDYDFYYRNFDDTLQENEDPLLPLISFDKDLFIKHLHDYIKDVTPKSIDKKVTLKRYNEDITMSLGDFEDLINTWEKELNDIAYTRDTDIELS